MGVCGCSMFCYTLLYVHSSIAIILMGKRELIALLNLSSWCLVMVERLFLAMPRGCLQFVIVVFPDQTHLLFYEEMSFEAIVDIFLGALNLLLSRLYFCPNMSSSFFFFLHLLHIIKVHFRPVDFFMEVNYMSLDETATLYQEISLIWVHTLRT